MVTRAHDFVWFCVYHRTCRKRGVKRKIWKVKLKIKEARDARI